MDNIHAMITRFLIPIIFLFLGTFIVDAQTCKDLPANFNSYTEALSKVRSASYLFKEEFDCSKSSWMHNASYFSCDGKTGYFIMRTKEGREYIHKDLPIQVWRQFKGASSLGNYYNLNIRGKYQLRI